MWSKTWACPLVTTLLGNLSSRSSFSPFIPRTHTVYLRYNFFVFTPKQITCPYTGIAYLLSKNASVITLKETDLSAQGLEHRGNWESQCNHNFREILSDWVEHVELNWAVQTEETATRFQRNLLKTKKLNSQATEQASLLTVSLECSFTMSVVLTLFCDSFASLDGMKGWWSY
jgi:hypothetical protein